MLVSLSLLFDFAIDLPSNLLTKILYMIEFETKCETQSINDFAENYPFCELIGQISK